MKQKKPGIAVAQRALLNSDGKPIGGPAMQTANKQQQQQAQRVMTMAALSGGLVWAGRGALNDLCNLGGVKEQEARNAVVAKLREVANMFENRR